MEENISAASDAESTPSLADFHDITRQARAAMTELLEAARLEKGDICVIGCSTSEVGGLRIGSASSMDVARALLAGLLPPLEEAEVYAAAQCCEHLNRAVVLERAAAREYRYERVNAIPQRKAGGSFATVLYEYFAERDRFPWLVEHVSANAGIDIGQTLIGMHLRDVAVPVRLSLSRIGEVVITAARTRPKFTGGSRAVYDEGLL